MTSTRLVRVGGIIAVSAIVFIGLSCGPSKKSGGNSNDAAIICSEDDECPSGMLCIGNICQYPEDGGIDVAPMNEPDIDVEPGSLDFGFAPLRVDTMLPLTVTNNGNADLEITAIIVEEVDQLQEYHASPEGVQSPPVVVAPGASTVIEVTLRPEDAELDTGQIRINSNDPDESSITVPVTSGYKGLPDLDPCVLDATSMEPEPFVDCATADITGDPIIDFGVVQFQQDASQVVVVRNLADGNAPLTIDNIEVSNTTGQGGHFSLEIFWLEVDPGGDSTEIPVTPPVHLRAADPVLVVEEDRLYVRIWFDADLDGFLPEEHLIYTSNDTDGELAIPIFGVVSGCPTGTWDINGDPNDGCEYACDYVGPELCDGVDNNCDGETDEEDALGCTNYYLDVDNDAYGLTSDVRCLCQPDTQTHHTATTDGDCDDTKQTVNPGMVEQCSTTDDDDCDGDTNDPGAFGCTNFYLDVDTDTYGVTADVQCLCIASGSYTASVGGDCDDTNVAVNPGQTEDCFTLADDDCNGSTNDVNALNCIDHYVDLDGDSYGQTFLSQCLCQGQGNYTATLPNDCNDNNPLVNPAAQEDCFTSFDDNCNMDTNELGALNCTNYYFDADNDNHGLDADLQCRCAPLGNYRATVGGDCNDTNGQVSPSAFETCATIYDDNCDGDTNDLNATGCTLYYLDQDTDTFGLAGNAQCRCNPQGDYQALVPGDCNDTDGFVNPAAAENCLTPYDDNCDADTNTQNALNCTSFFWDEDTDGYGTSVSQCRCAGYDHYTAPLSGDCLDQNPAVNPGVVEICDDIDNNCAGGIDEGFDKLTDVNHCGACYNQCTNPHGTTECINGVCTPTCLGGWGDCNGDPDDGCETDLSTVTTCGSCTQDTDCPPDYYCDGTGICQAEQADGEVCSRDEECTSGYCVDGHCCDTLCDGTCEACDIAGSEGTCTDHAVGLDPESECSGTSQDTCGQNGFCDGSGACDLWAVGTVCVQQTCSGNTLYQDDTCDGSGACVDGGTVDCSPYVCNGDACRTNCSDDAHCVSGNYCTGGACVSKKPNGQVCIAGNECQSGSCTDGVCCDTPCVGLCRSCALGGTVGTCTNVGGGLDPDNECGLCRTCSGTGSCVNATDGTDPKAECTATAQSTCGFDGECNGTGGCRSWAFGTECVAQTCTGNTKYLLDACNGAGTCVDGGSVDCSPYLCLGDDCRTSCTLNSHCVAGSWCSGGFCVGQKGLGQSCTGGAECLSGNCVDGVCCNTACAGVCLHCNLAGSVGNCVSIPGDSDPDGECGAICLSCNGAGACAATTAGIDPENDCAVQAQSTCDNDGECNGAGACRSWVSGTECVAQTCVGFTRYPADTCNGTGTCVDNGSVSCAPYVCNATGDDCRTDCSLDSHCTAGNYCNGGLCAAKKPIGQTCSAGTECVSGNCVDGYCCDSTCTGACRACNVAGVEGTCTNHPANTDPEAGCGTCRACNGTGTCANVAAGTDPLDQCTITSQDTCSYDGQCDGAGACNYWAAGTECDPAFCSGVSVKTLADLCNGSGTCVDSGTQNCAPYICENNDCRATCTLDGHCVTGYWCDAGACELKKASGQACTINNECTSGFCTDGVCCNVQCSSQCLACNLAGAVGTCTPHPAGTDPEVDCGLCQVCNGSGACSTAAAGTDPKAECAASAPSTCGNDGDCNGSGACRLWILGTECVPQSCTGSTRYNADECNGAGSCVDNGTVDCAPYTCLGDDCRTSCTLQTDCSAGNYCNTSTNACVSKKPNGISCSAGLECDSGICTDGVCCNSLCGGTCQACNIAGNFGTCTNHAAQTDPETECGLCRVCNGSAACVSASDGTDPKVECVQEAQSSCGQDGFCNGSGACGDWAAGTECVAQTCSAAIQYNADTCNGSGTCVDGGTTSCSPYQCGGDTCRTDCGSDINCVAGYYCNGSTCVSQLSNGQACSTANQCSSGFCVDGVCCNSSCTGDCRACDNAGSVGTCANHIASTDPESDCGLCQACNGTGACANVAASTDPLGQCALEAQSSCQQDGFCDGAGACDLWAAGTICNAALCIGSTLQVADQCNGTGVCVDQGNTDCSPYMCNATSDACRASCTLNVHCVSGFHCAGGFCVPDSPAGTPCVLDSECASTFCRDGYCCNADCGGACRACDNPGVEGTCTNHAADTDPEDECGTCRLCNGTGACENVPNGADPLDDCAADPQSTCQYDGVCNGSAACRQYTVGTVCVAQTCTGWTQYTVDSCNGSGTCVDGGTVDCSPYLCLGDACRSNCTLDSHCVSGYYCNGSACVLKKSNGVVCLLGSECSSGFCTDGVCCNAACGGTCEACDRAGSIGTCSDYAANTDPESECGPACHSCNGSGACTNSTDNTDPEGECTAAGPCGFDGDCDGSGACGYYPASTVCVAQTCVGHTQFNADFCDGAGTCADSGITDCSPYLCNGTVCRVNCTLDSHCVAGYYCGGGSCQLKKANGVACTLGNECQSSNCVDGVCCNNTCTGACQACDRAGSVGTCSYHPSNTDPEGDCNPACRTCNGSGGCTNALNNTDPENECVASTPSTCGLDGDCNGAGACGYWPASTSCNDQVCVGSTLYYEDFCNGGGTCVNAGTQACANHYACDAVGVDCRTTCTIDAHCAGGYFCTSGNCCPQVSTNSGTACGGGNLFTWSNNNSVPEGGDFVGNLVGVTQRWYRFKAVETLNNLNVWAWLNSNPGDEFRIEVRFNDAGEVQDCSTSVYYAGCGADDTHYQLRQVPYAWYSDDTKTVYVRVYRKTGATPTCNNYTLRVRVGGQSPPAGWASTWSTPGTCGYTCTYHNDGDCDDGGPGSQYSLCALGTDCADCGVR